MLGGPNVVKCSQVLMWKAQGTMVVDPMVVNAYGS